MKLFYIAQVFGIIGMATNILSYQAKKQNVVIIIQFFGSLFFAINMFMLKAYTGAILNAIGIIRALIYANKERIKNLKIFNVTFITIYILSYFLVFLLSDKAIDAFNLIVEILPVLAMISTTVSFSKTNAADLRKFALISSPLWLIYNCVNFAIGGILCEVFSLFSVVLAIFRLDRKKGDNNEIANS